MAGYPIVLRVGECHCIPEVNRLMLPPTVVVLLTQGGITIEQKFVLKKLIVPGRDKTRYRAEHGLHFDFDAHQRVVDGRWHTFLTLSDKVPYAGREDWRCVTVGNKKFIIKDARWKTWEAQKTIVNSEETLHFMSILLQRHFRKHGVRGFNEWLTRMTVKGRRAPKVRMD